MKLQDLKRGMRCTTRDEDVFIVGSVIIDNAYENCIAYLTVSKNSNIGFNNMNEDLTGGDSNNDIVRVEDITIDGYVTIWERQEPELYTLSLPNCSFKNRYLEISLEDNTRYRFKRKPKHNKPHEVKDYLDNKVVETYISVFTDEDIRNISNAKLINLLDKEVFEEEREVE